MTADVEECFRKIIEKRNLPKAEDELKRLEDLQNARKELERTQREKPVSQKMFKAI